MEPVLSEAEIAEISQAHPAWILEDGKLTRECRFKDFLSAIRFVNHIASLAEDAGHHPDIDIRYNRVRLGLVSHDAGGITRKDKAMTEKIEQQIQDSL